MYLAISSYINKDIFILLFNELTVIKIIYIYSKYPLWYWNVQEKKKELL